MEMDQISVYSGVWSFLSDSQSGIYQLQIVDIGTLKITPFQL